jgi:hypothetical protein
MDAEKAFLIITEIAGERPCSFETRFTTLADGGKAVFYSGFIELEGCKHCHKGSELASAIMLTSPEKVLHSLKDQMDKYFNQRTQNHE